jgi:hypothetical protein
VSWAQTAGSELRTVVDSLTGGRSLDYASQDFKAGNYVRASLHAAQAVAEAGLTVFTLGEFALIRSEANLIVAGTREAAALRTNVGVSNGGRIPHAGGVVRQFTQETEQVYYRVFTENLEGSFLTAVPPRNSKWAQEALALPPGNNATYIQEVLVPAGTRLERSRALGAFGRRGGGEQFELLQKIPSKNFGPGKPMP